MSAAITLLNLVLLPFASLCLYKLLAKEKIALSAGFLCEGFVAMSLSGGYYGVVKTIMRNSYNLIADVSQTRVVPYMAVFALVLPVVVLLVRTAVGMSVTITGNKTGKKGNGIVLPVLFTAIGLVLVAVCWWMRRNYDIKLNEIIYTLGNSLEGADMTIVRNGVMDCLPWVLAALVFFVVVFVIVKQNVFESVFNIRLFGKTKGFKLSRHHNIIIALAVMLYGMTNIIVQYEVIDYLRTTLSTTTIYEDCYVSPADVEISARGEKRNLIYIYLESMETTYASRDEGGYQGVNYIPYLTQLAKEEANFTETGKLGGFHNTAGSEWTMGSLFSTTAGIPFSFPVSKNNMSEYDGFAKGTVTLYDVLEQNGYNQYFICGSNAEFGGRANYYRSHGDLTIYDLYTAREEGYIAEDYFVWWGYEDFVLYDIAKDKILEAAQQEEPFNFVMLTVDTHFTDGYICDLCGDEYGSIAANVVSCADRQIEEFMSWCKEQDFYEDTTIVVIGDHPRMDLALVEGISDYDRTTYATIVNAAVDHSYSRERVYTQLDIFPTVVYSLGFDIEGDRLGLGTNLFSQTPTLAEQLGFEELNTELQKGSDYYMPNFS